MRTSLWRFVAVGVFLLVLAAAPALRAAQSATGDWVDRKSIEVEREEGGLTVRLGVANPGQAEALGDLEIVIADLDGNALLRGRHEIALKPGENLCTLRLSGTVSEERIPLCVLTYRLSAPGRQEEGTRSLLAVIAQLETRLVAYRDLVSGSGVSVRVVALNHATGQPVPDAEVQMALVRENEEIELYRGKTDQMGTLDAGFTVPDWPDSQADLRITVSSARLGADSVVQPVSVRRKARILLTTDKPLYQPGQSIQMRALCLDVAGLNPVSGKPFTFEVMDAKGNKVFKNTQQSNEYGIASAVFQLASEVNLGPYIVRGIVEGAETEKQVSVERYVLPKFKVNVSTDRNFYLPGETVKGEVQADYFFGKPVAGGRVEIVASKFEIEFTEFARVEGTLDAEGHWTFEMPLPDYFAGTPIEQGEASVRFETVVVDTADHREEKVIMTPVAAAPLNVFAVPESGTLVPNLDNQVYVLVSEPDGAPVNGAGVRFSGVETRTDELGIAMLTINPKNVETVQAPLEVVDSQGRTVKKTVELTCTPGAESLILRADNALYAVGDTIRAEALSSKQTGTVYFDLVRAGQTVVTRSAELKAGKAELLMDVDAAMTGSLTLQAYVFTPGTDLVRDTRLLYVNPADALQFDIALDKETYKPGEPAKMLFAVSSGAGAPTPAAIGVAIVDESVFALQEIHPGLEKIYFTLEKEIMQPRYEIHGYDLEGMVKGPIPMEGRGAQPAWSSAQQEAAKVLLASAPEPPAPPVHINTFDSKQQAAGDAVQKRIDKDYNRIHSAISRLLNAQRDGKQQDVLKALLRGKYLRENDLLDPWGNRYIFDFSSVEQGQPFFTMISCGPDEIEGTQDDLRWPMMVFAAGPMGGRGGMLKRGGVAADMLDAVPMAMPALESKMEQAEAVTLPEQEAVAGPAPVRLREYFPETLLFEPALITDEQGRATLEVVMADSITTWRMTAMASSRGGLLGSNETPMRVFQDFFVDIDLPVALTQHDQVSIPVVLYNYLDTRQQVRLKFETEPWFKLDGEAERTIDLEPGAVTSMYFPIEVVELGAHRLTVYAYGTQMSDAIRRQIDVLPDGEERNTVFSDRLSATVEHRIEIPAEAVDGASKVLVRLYPGVYSQIVEGLDSMLQMPCGCFEQTSAATYPNILVVQYMKATDQINPEIQMKAEGFINAGYQRLLAYEVQGGGFSWFGDAPANQVLTAWGLKEFFDMSQVHDVDPAVLDRTRAWLLAQQQPDGSWKPDAQYLHAESWAGIQGSGVLVTSYILDAILSTGGAAGNTQKAIDYLKANWKDSEDAYTLALLANALVSWNAKDPWTAMVLDRLHELRIEERDTVHWKGAATVTFADGDAADVETTALAAIAFMRAGKYAETSTKALTYLIQKKGAQGHWGSTQATILALKALMISLGNQTEKTNATVKVILNGSEAASLAITPDDCDVMRLVDLGDKTVEGPNTVRLEFHGEGSMLYQIVGRYYMPWQQIEPLQDAMSIAVTYDKSALAVNDLVTASIKVTNNRPAAAQMIIVDLGIAPGFQVITADLDALVEKGTVQKYELTNRQVICYFERIGGNETIEFSYKLRAKFPLRAQTPESTVYEYYNREVKSTAEPQTLEVK